MDLFSDITNCDNIKQVYNCTDGCICDEIIRYQKTSYNDFQIPEPWTGNLDEADVLFISSLNPGYDKNENYPSYKWGQNEIMNFFENRFNNRRYTSKEFKPLDKTGENLKMPHYWSEVQNILELITGTNQGLGYKRYAMTEIVHCKSKKWTCFKKSGRAIQKECENKFLKRILDITNASVIICFGSEAKDYFWSRFKNIYQENSNFIETVWNDKKRIIVFLGQPGSSQPRMDIIKKELEKIKEYIPVKLRAHHLLCIEGFVGKGYSDDFVSNMKSVIEKLDKNPEVLLAYNSDEICKKCPKNINNICSSVGGENEVKKMDLAVFKAISFKSGDCVSYSSLKKAVNERFKKKSELAEICGVCSWKETCPFYTSKD
jgi:hypothetical protein